VAASYRRSTQPLTGSERDQVRPFLEADPVGNAVVWNRAFQLSDYRDVYTDGLPPKAVLAMAKPQWASGATGIAMHAVDAPAARELIPAVPPGPAFLHLTEEWQLPLFEAKAEEMQARTAWLFALDKEDFVDQQTHEVRPLTPEWAAMIAKVWEPDWPGEPYVRSRIEAGHAYGVYEEGKPVAWALTHFETERVSMMGFLHVVEAYRGKGYAKSVGSALIKDILARGKIPALHVYVDNVASLQLTPALGFHKVKRQVWADAVFR